MKQYEAPQAVVVSFANDYVMTADGGWRSDGGFGPDGGGGHGGGGHGGGGHDGGGLW